MVEMGQQLQLQGLCEKYRIPGLTSDLLSKFAFYCDSQVTEEV